MFSNITCFLPYRHLGTFGPIWVKNNWARDHILLYRFKLRIPFIINLDLFWVHFCVHIIYNLGCFNPVNWAQTKTVFF